ncbi:unnamed protein product [Echinostoma caproni]|uniref:Uncharacterized protein n=1 Tax=Echinostoma caproni TaxID=27848 RepID=A0A3P8LBG8_9TREM|nr:unnamed protein product [Echinostoma caproni]
MECNGDQSGFGLIPWCPEWSPPSQSSSRQSEQISTSASKFDIPPVNYVCHTASPVHKRLAQSTHSAAINKSASRGAYPPAQEIDPLAALFGQSPLQSLDASLNCPHYKHGFNQLCVICWLNNPDQWVFGPALSPLDRSIFACLDKLANMANSVAGLTTASTLLSRPTEAQAELRSGLASPSATVWPNILIRTDPCSTSGAVSLQPPCPPRKRQLSCDRLDRLLNINSGWSIIRSFCCTVHICNYSILLILKVIKVCNSGNKYLAI